MLGDPAWPRPLQARQPPPISTPISLLSKLLRAAEAGKPSSNVEFLASLKLHTTMWWHGEVVPAAQSAAHPPFPLRGEERLWGHDSSHIQACGRPALHPSRPPGGGCPLAVPWTGNPGKTHLGRGPGYLENVLEGRTWDYPLKGIFCLDLKVVLTRHYHSFHRRCSP